MLYIKREHNQAGNNAYYTSKDRAFNENKREGHVHVTCVSLSHAIYMFSPFRCRELRVSQTLVLSFFFFFVDVHRYSCAHARLYTYSLECNNIDLKGRGRSAAFFRLFWVLTMMSRNDPWTAFTSLLFGALTLRECVVCVASQYVR